jgi:hypothetical protein
MACDCLAKLCEVFTDARIYARGELIPVVAIYGNYMEGSNVSMAKLHCVKTLQTLL